MLTQFCLLLQRDYTLSKIDESDLSKLQSSFVTEMLAAQDSWEVISGERIPKGRELEWFVTAGALEWHISCAVQFPLADDNEAQRWLLHEFGIVQKSAILAVPQAELLALAQWFDDNGEYWKEARLLGTFAQWTDLPKVEATKHYNHALAILGKVEEDRDSFNATAKDFANWKCRVAYALFVLAGPRSAEGQLAMSQLIAMYKSGQEMGASAKKMALIFMAFPLIGFFPMLPDPTSAQLYEGQQHFREVCRLWLACMVSAVA